MTTSWTARFEVVASDALRRERLLRSLRDELVAVDDVEVNLASSPPPQPGGKGAIESTAAILVAAAPLAQPTAEVLKATITGWLQRDRRTVLRATVGDRTVELTGEPSAAQQRLLDTLLAPDTDSER